MTDGTLATAIATASAMAAAGLVFGIGYFAALRRTVHLYGFGRDPFGSVALTLGRIAAAVIFLVFAARLGALPLLAAFLGFLLARMLALRAVRRAG
ncbi:MAG: ATP synthase subunit I [Stellaceae bacterium]